MKTTSVKAAIFLLIALFSFGVVAQETTRYISDKLYVPLRGGKGNQFKILHRGLASGTKLALIEEDLEEGWALVRMDNGTEGWLRIQYLANEPIAELLLESALKNEKKATDRMDKAKAQLKEVKTERNALAKAVAELETNNKSLTKELNEIKKISSNAIDLSSRHQELLEKNQMLENRIDVLDADNGRLKSDSNHTWFLYGGILVIASALITALLPYLRPRRRSSEWV